ncbi:uncharacterized protein LOC132616693 isoform X2 [Lycium barbarum]|uniref:uncharacterized protein LOC132616693 isoform X2 n=1 Tax=Lycium barbarum TaxID=112863 RepID=UPI00293EA007|nr:uncharacterized protein LOC132616693 isoform X2 [Lycium barbarum]XP_060187255.1 uncharacterized protein LOC132616693 isoform X2 [Lycium barbarum]
MGGGSSTEKKKIAWPKDDFIDLVLSWSIKDIFDDTLYQHQVEKIPQSFESAEHYIGSFFFPLLEETRADIASSLKDIVKAPFAELISFDEVEPNGAFDVKVDYWRNKCSDGRVPYRTSPGDIVVISKAKPEAANDLQRSGYWTFASVIDANENDALVNFKVRVPPYSGIVKGMRQSCHIAFLVNVMPNNRVWDALRMRKNLNMIEKVLHPVPEKRIGQKCDVCSTSINDESVGAVACNLLSKLNNSQASAILTSLANVKCRHKASVELIYGPPGTGKTRTLSAMLVTLLRMKCRTITCAPTDVATARVASKLVQLVQETYKNEFDGFCPLGDILLFGNNNCDDGEDIAEISLDYRVGRLVECLAPMTGWNHCVSSMINFLEELSEQEEAPKVKVKNSSLIDFSQFSSIASSLRKFLLTICTHVPIRFLRGENVESIVRALSLLNSHERMLFHKNAASKSLVLLKDLQKSLGKLDFPTATRKDRITEFCIQMAFSVFSSASTSYKLHSVDMEPFDLLVVDDACQLKECEAVIPLQLRGLRHTVLAGGACQLSTLVKSRISREVGFGRSLFERLISLGHSKHLLNVQYRMHPSISQFPNSILYGKQILDAPDVKCKAYEKIYLKGQCFAPYTFINVPWGEEELDNLGHRRNLVEVALVMQIVQSLFKAWNTSNKKLSIGVISPYAAQVLAIQDRLGQKYNNHAHFEVNVKTVDRFQGGENDIVIISTVRSNRDGSIGFLSSLHWTNVALTRARHCLWILGNEQMMLDSNTIWEALVLDAKDRLCFFHADDDTDMRKTLLDVKKELDQLDDFLSGDSILFKEQRWKVVFSDNFRKSFRKLASSCLRKYVLTLLVKLASGWRPKRNKVELVCESSTQVVKQFKVVEGRYIVCTVDIQKEDFYTQVLKVWDILPLEEVAEFLKRLDAIYLMYTKEFINLCKEKHFKGDWEVPKSWEIHHEIVQYKKGTQRRLSRDSNGALNDVGYLEKSRVSESFLLMKFYSLSSGMVTHLLSDRYGEEVDIPFEVTNEEREIIRFSKSSFILGRSGTGKTTVLTMKLFQKEQHYHSSVHGLSVAEGNEISQSAGETRIRLFEENEEDQCLGETSKTTLHQLFVTVSPKLCYAVNKQVSQLKRFALGGSFWAESSFETDDLDGMTHFRDIPNSFIAVPYKKYPLVITFHKFLMMLDGTIGSSYFDRFNLKWKLSKDKSLRAVSLETFIREKEINYDRFCCLYWPHFRSQLTKNLDPSRVFTEIMSHIKGGLHAGDFLDGKLSRDAYVSMSEHRVSNLSEEKREGIYDIFQTYEKMKMTRGEFDLSDLVNDLHLRLKCCHLDGDKMDFVYVDEVQDLTMRQISLFKYICRNVDKGFVFSGDTAQTIARGVDFRFEDIRNLFYTEFVMKSKGDARRKDKGHISSVFQLLQNFRTHTGVLQLAQSVINLLAHYFPQSVDVLKPETSLVDGAAPVLLKPGDDENAIKTIFGNKGNNSGKLVGFGAEQVILVRDESAKKEITHYVGQRALVLTIVECKGLEFEDVLMYNFFSSSPLGNQWRVVYEYMKEQSLADLSFPSFCDARHNIWCSELKQLYVAITRTRQRLWICESVDEFSRPMFDYWKMLSLVEVREVDDFIADTMQTFSTPDEWKSRGLKLFWEKNYKMALMCFKKAGETNWERRAKAAGLRATVEQIRYTDPEKARTCLLEAAEIFYSIGRFESAAECFYDLEDYQRAGNIYLHKCGALLKAAECFLLAGRYKQAARVYAKGNYFTECLSACTKGKCYYLGLEYIEDWKQNALQRTNAGKTDEIGKKFLENCAYNYFELKDTASMMKFVKAFPSMDMKRKFLMSRKCLDELLLLEEESGNFAEAAEIAWLNGDILCEADLLGKGGDFDKACSLVLLYVLSHSLWMDGSEGWPLKSFVRKDELLKKATSFAKHGSNFETMCTEIKVLARESADWSDLKHIFSSSQKSKSFLGEMLCCRKILDFHIRVDVKKYVWDDKLLGNLHDLEELISCCQVSVGTMLHFWNSWKKNVIDVLDSIQCLGDVNYGEFKEIGEFCLKYFGARQQMNGLNITYVLLHPAAEWVKNIQNFVIKRNKQMVFVDARHFISAARTHWHTELLVVGLKVLETLASLYELAVKSMPLFCQSMCLLNVYEIAKFLLDSEHHDGRIHNFLILSGKYFEKIFPLDPRQSMVDSMIVLRRTKLSCDVLQEFIVRDIGTSDLLSYGQIGRIVMIWLASGNLSEELYKKVVGRIPSDVPWKSFFETLNCMKQRECMEDFESGDSVGGKLLEFQEVLSSDGNLECSEGSSNNAAETMEVTLLREFCDALQDTFSANWMKIDDFFSPVCFLYLLERFLILVSQYRGIFFTAKSSFVEWLISEQFEARKTSTHAINTQLLEEFYDSVLVMVQELIYDKAGTVKWIARSRINIHVYYKQMFLRLVLVLCLLCVNCWKYYDVLFKVLSIDDVRNQLPEELYDILQRGMEINYVQINDFGEAFEKCGDSLLVVTLGEIVTEVECPNVVSVQLGTNCSREDILSLLLPPRTDSSLVQTVTVPEVMSDPSAKISVISGDQPNSLAMLPSAVTSVSDQQMNWAVFQEISNVLKSIGNDGCGTSALDLTVNLKEEMNANMNFLTGAINLCSGKKLYAGEDMMEEACNMLQELLQLNSLMNKSTLEQESIEQLLKSILSKKPKLEAFLNQLIVPKDVSVALENQRAEKLDVACNEVALTDLLPSVSTFETRGGDQGAGKQGKGKGKYKKRKGKRRN